MPARAIRAVQLTQYGVGMLVAVVQVQVPVRAASACSGSSGLLKKSSRDAAQDAIDRKSAVYIEIHEHFEVNFDAAMRPSRVFQQPAK
jgi:hypothetical protein